MKALTKAILFTRATRGNKVEMTPVGVWRDANACRQFAVAILSAHKSGNADALKALGVSHLLSEDGTVLPNLKFSRVTVPYEPAAMLLEEDPFAEPSSPAS